MASIEELENKLNTLRLKWSSGFPKDVHDPRWPAFRVDKSHTLYLKSEIEKLKSQTTEEIDEFINKERIF